jgi:hypothetical protein
MSCDLGETVHFRPFPPNRRGELVAWALVVSIASLDGYLYLRTGSVGFIPLFFLALFTIAAGFIRFSHWLDGRTSIQLTGTSVRYQSPLRKVDLPYGDIREMLLLPVGEGWRILVLGPPGRYFRYRTPTAIGRSDQRPLQVGIMDGHKLTACIRVRAGLTSYTNEGDSWVCR